MVKHIPNFFTCCNLLCGCVGIVEAFGGNLTAAAYFIGLAAVFDFLDGLSARMLKAVSSIGKQLDSFADLISFGLLPSVILFFLIKYSLYIVALAKVGIFNYHHLGVNMAEIFKFIPYIAFLMPLFSAFRLAKFNIDTRQTDSFLGLPTPANAILIGSFPLILKNNNKVPVIDGDLWGIYGDLWRYDIDSVLLNPYILISLVLVLSYLLIAKLPLFSLKFNDISWRNNKYRFIFLMASLVLVLILFYTAIPIIITLYLILSALENYFKKSPSIKLRNKSRK